MSTLALYNVLYGERREDKAFSSKGTIRDIINKINYEVLINIGKPNQVLRNRLYFLCNC